MMISLALVLAAQSGPDSWGTLPDVPRNVDVGGCAAAVGADAIYVCTGGRGQNFYRYTPSILAWTPAAPLPSFYGAGSGASMVYDPQAGRIYALAGNQTAWFYEYDPATDTWRQLADYPAYAGDGTRLTAMLGRIYAIGGNPFDEDWTWRGDLFYAYDPALGLWDTLPTTPFVTQALGASMAYPGSGMKFYLSVGYPTLEFWSYDGGWNRLADLPGSEMGGVVTCGGPQGGIFALLGQALWRYDVVGDRWDGREVAPGSIGAGASMAFDGQGRLYVPRGAATQSFWCFHANSVPHFSAMGQSLAIGGTAYGTPVLLSMAAEDADGQALRVEIEVVTSNLPFTGVATRADDWSTIPSRAFELDGLAAGSYRWSARVVDSLDAASPWVVFSGNDIAFNVSHGPPPLVVPIDGSVDTASCFASAGAGACPEHRRGAGLALLLPLLAILCRIRGVLA